MSEVSESPLELVRRYTHTSHQRVEALTQELGVLSHVSTFARHLQTLWRHHTQELRRVAQHPELAHCVNERVNELAHDIAHLGAPVPAALPSTPAPLSWPAALGVVYVIEGSRLGAFAIEKRLTKNGIATRGLLSVGGDLSAIRQRFQITAHRINALSPDDAKTMADAATASFDDLLAAYGVWRNEGEYLAAPSA